MRHRPVWLLAPALLAAMGGGSAWGTPVPADRFVSLGPPSAPAEQVLVHPLEGRLLFLLAAGEGGGVSRLYRSLDGGDTWSAPQDGLPYLLPAGGTQAVSRVVVDPRYPSIAYWIVRHVGRSAFDPRVFVYRTDDHGASWAAIHSHFDPLGVAGQLELFFPPSTPRMAWARNTSSAGTRFWRSRNFGETWWLQPDLTALPEEALEPGAPLVRYRAVVPANAIERSDDGGSTWRVTGTTPYHPLAISGVVGGVPDGRVYLGTSDLVAQFPAAGVFRSDDSGATWRQVNSGLGDLRVGAIAASLDPTGLVYAATPSGLFVSRDGGESWSSSAAGPGRSVRSVATVSAPGGPALLAGAFRSTDGGGSWQGVPELAGGEPRFATATGTATVYALLPQESGTGSLLRSDDGGATWIALAAASCHAIAVAAPEAGAPGPSARLFCLEREGSGPELVVRRSDDGGASFVELHRSAALPPGQLAPVEPMDLVVAARPDGKLLLFVVANVGFENTPGSPQIRVSEDGGATWRASAVGDQGFWVHDALAAQRGARLLLATSAGILASEDGGESWASASRGLELAGSLVALAESAAGGELFAGTTQSLYRSRDGGATWQRFDEGARGAFVHGIEVDAEDGLLLLATSHGVLARGLSGAACAAAEATLCLRDGAYRVEATWEGLGAGIGAGRASPISSDTGAFWFFEPGNLELVVKVLDGCALNGRQWVFFTGLTDLATDVRVTRVADGVSRRYRRGIGGPLHPVLDVEAFECP